MKMMRTKPRREVSPVTRALEATALVLGVFYWFSFAEIADACAVCYGDPESPMVQSMKWGIILLLGVITSVLAGFATLFGYWMYRSKQYHLSLTEGATN